MSKQAVALIAALLVAAGLLVAGCGDDDADAGSEPTITKAALIEQGDALCAKIQKSITAQGTEVFNKPEQKNGPGFRVRVVEEVLEPEFQTMVDDIRELGGPTNDKAQREAMLDAMEERVKVMAEDPKGFFKPSPVSRREFKEMLALVKGYGFTKCYQ